MRDARLHLLLMPWGEPLKEKGAGAFAVPRNRRGGTRVLHFKGLRRQKGECFFAP